MKNKRSVKSPGSILKKNVPIVLTAAFVVAGIAGGGYYLSVKQKTASDSLDTTVQITTTNAEVQQNVEQKNAAATDATSTPSVVASTPTTTTLNDVSLSVYRSDDTAEVSLYGPSGTYGVEELVGGTWTNLVGPFDYSGRGGRNVDTIESATPESHYRVYLISGGTRTRTSGDTVVSWQQLLNNGGTLSVPLAE